MLGRRSGKTSDSAHDERADYADEPSDSLPLIDRLFLGVFPVHLVLFTFVPCWWPFAPFALGWAALGIMVCRHPIARRSAIGLSIAAVLQLVVIALMVLPILSGRR